MKRWFPLLFIFLAAPLWSETQSFNKFSGLNTDDSPLQLQEGQTPDSENVVTDLGPGVQGRLGFIFFATQTPRAMWEFPKSDGTRYLIADLGDRLLADTGAGTFSIFVSTVPSDRTVAGSVLGDRFYFSDTLNGLKYWNATSVVVASTSMTVDKLVTWKGRLAAAGKSGTERIIYLSKYLDGTSWTAPVDPSEDDAAQIPVSGALDENIQALFSSFKDLLVWFKKNSFGGIYGSRRSNFSQRTFSDYIGVANPETIRDCDGFLRWLGNNRVVWEFNGTTYEKISNQVTGLFNAISQGDSSARSNTQTSQADFEAGSQSPSGFGDTTTAPGSLTPRTTTFIDTSGTEWALGTDSPSGYTNRALPGFSLQLATASTEVIFTESSQADWQAGTLTNLDATTAPGNLGLQLNSGIQLQQYGADSAVVDGASCSAGCDCAASQSFTTPSDKFLLHGITVRLRKISLGGSPPMVRFYIYNDSANSPGSSVAVALTDVAVSTLTTSFSDYTVQFSSIALSAGTRYWLRMTSADSPFSSAPGTPWAITTGSFSESKRSSNSGCVNSTSENFKYQVLGTSWTATGNFVSQTFDVGFTTSTWLWTWGPFSGNQTLNGGSIDYETQTSSSATGIFTSLQSVTLGNNPTSTVQRFFRYKASFSTPDTSRSPELSELGMYIGARIRPTAIFTSRTFDTGIDTPAWGLFASSKSFVGSGGTYASYTQSSVDGTNWDAAVAAINPSIVASARKRYVRYLWVSSATSPSDYNVLDEISINAKSTGTFTTQAVNVGNLISSWGPVGAALSNDGGGFTIQFATSTDGVSFNTWTTIANNSIPAVSTAPYAKTRFLFDLDIATDTPTLNDVTINWTEGSTIRAASAYINQRYWLAVALSASTNNRVFVFDKTRQWQRYNGINIAATALYNSKLYFGNSSGIFQAENGYSDNGTAITSYYKTPTTAPAGLDSKAKYLWLYTTTDNSDSTLSTSYQIDGQSTDYNFGSSLMNTTSGIQNIKLPFSVEEVQEGRLISLRWSVAGTSFWRVLNGNVYFDRDTIPE